MKEKNHIIKKEFENKLINAKDLPEKAIMSTTETIFSKLNSNHNLLEERSNLRFSTLEEHFSKLVEVLNPKFPSINPKSVRSEEEKPLTSSKNSPHNCDICNDSFVAKRSFANHIRTKHKSTIPS